MMPFDSIYPSAVDRLHLMIKQATDHIYNTWFIRDTGHGFQDGGCWMLAEALRRWSGDRVVLRYICRNDRLGLVQHVVVAMDRWLMDSDGVFTPGDMLTKVGEEWRPAIPLTDMSILETEVDMGDIPFDQAVVEQLLADLMDLLPDPATVWPDCIPEMDEVQGNGQAPAPDPSPSPW